MKIGVIGASGATGGIVVAQLVESGHDVRAMVRNDKAAARLPTADIATLDLTGSEEQAAQSMAGLDAVINAAAGTDGTQARAVDRDGVKAAIDAATAAGVTRWVQISMWGSDDRNRLPAMLRDTADAKRAADDHLAASGMTWTVVRPPWLTNEPASDRIVVGAQVEEGSLPREDLAAVAVACLDLDSTHDRLFEVTGGGEQSVRTALAGL